MNENSLRANLRADYKVNKRLLDRATLTVFRLNQWAHRGRLRVLKRAFAKMLDAIWLQLVIGADLPGRATVGPGLRMPHGGRGVTLHPRVRIGRNAVIYHRTTIGGFTADPSNVPTIGDDVYIGAAAQIMGRVTIGDGVRIGAGAQIASRGLTIGDGARLAAGAVPFDDVAPAEVVRGNPAAVYRVGRIAKDDRP